MGAFDFLTPTHKLIILCLLSTTVMLYFCSQVVTEQQANDGPCSAVGFPGKCYAIPQTMCEVVWDRSEGDCQEFVNNLNLPPGRLVGPIVSKCRHMKLDKLFVYSRKNTPECNEAFESLDLWKKRNQF